MRLFTISPENQQRLAIVVPIVALLLSLFVVYPTWQRYTALQATIKTNQSELDALRATPTPDVGTVTPAEIGLPSEPPVFFGQVRLMAQLAVCRVINFDLGTTAKEDAGPVRAVRAHVDLDGRYSQIREFLYQVSKAPRLYVVTQCSVRSDAKSAQAGTNRPASMAPPGTLHASIEIERYITPKVP